jgi:hypothetical protein
MKKHRRSQKWLIAVMGVMFLLAVIFWMYAVSGFSLAFLHCDATFSLDAKLLRCRRPVIFLLLFWACVIAGVGLGATALLRTLIRRRRS